MKNGYIAPAKTQLVGSAAELAPMREHPDIERVQLSIRLQRAVTPRVSRSAANYAYLILELVNVVGW